MVLLGRYAPRSRWTFGLGLLHRFLKEALGQPLVFCFRDSQRQCPSLLTCLNSEYLEFMRVFKGGYMVMDEFVLMINVFCGVFTFYTSQWDG